MAVASRMFSIAREEIPVVASELVSSATTRLSAGETSAAGAIREEAASISASSLKTGIEGVGMNPMAVRQMVQTTVKEGAESSILSQHLSLRSTGQTSSLLENVSSQSFGSTKTMTNTTSIVAQTLEMDAGVSLKEVMSNAGQTGVEEVMEQVNLGDLSKLAQ